MRQFYRVYEYCKTTDTTTNSVFFHDRENAKNYFDQLAWRAGALHWSTPSENDKIVSEADGSISAFGNERNVFFEVWNFED